MKTFGTNALISKIMSTVDGGYRLSLDVGENSLECVKELMELKKRNVQVAVVFQALGEDEEREKSRD